MDDNQKELNEEVDNYGNCAECGKELFYASDAFIRDGETLCGRYNAVLPN